MTKSRARTFRHALALAALVAGGVPLASTLGTYRARLREDALVTQLAAADPKARADAAREFATSEALRPELEAALLARLLDPDEQVMVAVGEALLALHIAPIKLARPLRTAKLTEGQARAALALAVRHEQVLAGVLGGLGPDGEPPPWLGHGVEQLRVQDAREAAQFALWAGSTDAQTRQHTVALLRRNPDFLRQSGATLEDAAAEGDGWHHNPSTLRLVAFRALVELGMRSRAKRVAESFASDSDPALAAAGNGYAKEHGSEPDDPVDQAQLWIELAGWQEAARARAREALDRDPNNRALTGAVVGLLHGKRKGREAAYPVLSTPGLQPRIRSLHPKVREAIATTLWKVASGEQNHCEESDAALATLGAIRGLEALDDMELRNGVQAVRPGARPPAATPPHPRARAPCRRRRAPPPPRPHRRVLAQLDAERPRVVGDGLIVVPHQRAPTSRARPRSAASSTRSPSASSTSGSRSRT